MVLLKESLNFDIIAWLRATNVSEGTLAVNGDILQQKTPKKVYHLKVSK